jgi:D-glycero-alpha-D-manno-heptose 1-phosphate guanylyltransferase
MTPESIDAVILTGGQGTRLRSVVNDRPKTMAEIDGRPFLDLVLDHLSDAGFNRFILCVGYRADYITQYYAEGHTRSCRIIFSRETFPLGTAGAVKNAEPLIASDPFLVVNGDSFCPADLAGFTKAHEKRSAQASMVLTHMSSTEDYGSIEIDGDDRIVQFREKAGAGAPWVNAGIYLFNRKVLSLIPLSTFSSLEHDVFPRLAGRAFFGYTTAAPLIDIGTPERYEEAQRVLSARQHTLQKS